MVNIVQEGLRRYHAHRRSSCDVFDVFIPARNRDYCLRDILRRAEGTRICCCPAPICATEEGSVFSSRSAPRGSIGCREHRSVGQRLAYPAIKFKWLARKTRAMSRQFRVAGTTATWRQQNTREVDGSIRRTILAVVRQAKQSGSSRLP